MKKMILMMIIVLCVMMVAEANARGFFNICVDGNNNNSNQVSYGGREFNVESFNYGTSKYLIVTRRGTTAFAVVPR